MVPSKIYPTKSGEELSSQQIAETLEEAIEHMSNELSTTSDAKKIRKLKDKQRSIRIWIHQHPDVEQYVKNNSKPKENQPTIGDVIEAMQIDIIKIREQICVSTNQQEIDDLKHLITQYKNWIAEHKDMPRDSFVDLA